MVPVGLTDARIEGSHMFVGRVPELVSGLDPETVPELMRAVTRRRARRSETVVGGRSDLALIIVEHGLLKVFRRQSDGRQVLHEVVWPGEVLIHIRLDDAKDHGIEVTATPGSVLHGAARDRWDQFQVSRPELRDRLHRYAYSQLLRSHQQAQDYLVLDTQTRVLMLLQNLCERRVLSEGSPAVEVRGISQKEFGELLGARRESVNRVLADLAAEGLILLGPKSIRILKPEHFAS